MTPLDTLRALPRDTLASIRFLSRLPVWRVASLDDIPDFRRSACTFPLAGLVIGAVGATPGLLLAWLGLPGLPAALFIVAGMVLVTGALHEDGLADVADGFWGGHSRERKLAIMRDSTIGTYGGLALGLSLLARVTLLSVLLPTGLVTSAGLVVCVAALSRGAMIVPWVILPPARPANGDGTGSKQSSGLSARYGEPDGATGLATALVSLPVVILLFVLSPAGAVAGMAFGASGVLAVLLLARHHIGGHTGDVLGATQQVCEVGLLCGLALAMS